MTDYENLWVGTFDVGHEGTWKWVDGRSLPLSSSSWHCGIPRLNANLNCGILGKLSNIIAGQNISRVGIEDHNCDDKKMSLCQLEVLY